MMLIFYTRTNCLMTLNRTSTPKILEVGRGGSVNSASRLLRLKPRVNSHSAFYTSHNPHPCFTLPPRPLPRLTREHLDPPLFADLESSTLPFSDFSSPPPNPAVMLPPHPLPSLNSPPSPALPSLPTSSPHPPTPAVLDVKHYFSPPPTPSETAAWLLADVDKG